MYDNKYVKEHMDDVFGTIEDFDLRLELTLSQMERNGCSFRNVDETLYLQMQDELMDWCLDNELNYEDFDLEEIIF